MAGAARTCECMHVLAQCSLSTSLSCSYDAVEELVAEDEMAFNVAACLAKLPKDLDK